ncbi:hypothetical protein ACWGOK_36065 [Streptomyces eurythermus]
MAAPLNLRRARHDTTPVISLVVAVGVVLASLLVYQSVNSQNRYSTLRTGQTTGLAQRTDQQQLTCALWAILRNDKAAEISTDMRQAADRICADVPTPTPSSSSGH